MSLADSLFDFAEGVSRRMLSGIKGRMSDCCPLETRYNDHTLVTRYNELVTVIEFRGTRELVGKREFEDRIESLQTLLNGVLERSYQSLQMVLGYNIRPISDLLNQHYELARRTARNIGLNMELVEELIQGDIEANAPHCNAWQSYLVLTTSPTLLPKPTHKKATERQARRTQGLLVREGDQVAPVLAGLPEVYSQHKAVLDTLLQKLDRNLGFQVRALEIHGALREAALLMDPTGLSPRWRPSLPGDPLPARETRNSALLYHPLPGVQIFKHQSVKHGYLFNYGRSWYAPVQMVLPQQEPESFAQLLQLVPKHIRWRLSISLQGGRDLYLNKVKSRRFWATLLKITNSNNNGAIIESADTLMDLVRNGEQLCGLRLGVVVMGDSREQVEEDVHRMARALQAWGHCDTEMEYGDPVWLSVAGLPGMDSPGVGNTLIAPIKEAATMLPVTVSSSPWPIGRGALFRLFDGTPYPYMPGTSLQHASVELTFAAQGGGKSVHNNSLNLMHVLFSGAEQLPRQAILDIGPSSKGYIELLEQLLPPGRRHQVLHKTLQNRKEDAINPFDTQTGARYPTPREFSFLVNFLSIVFTPNGAAEPPKMAPEIVQRLIQEVYRHFDEVAPKRYEPGLETALDELISARFPELLESDGTGRYPPLWDVVDRLMASGYTEEAGQLQLHAVPLLSDLGSILHESKTLKNIYGQVPYENSNMSLLDFMKTMLHSVVSDYAILTAPTRFNPTEARIVALDLGEVVQTVGKAGIKRAGLMYLLARHAIARDFYFNEQETQGFPARLREYHFNRLRASRGESKRLFMDEFHRFARLAYAVRQVELDGRETRKYNVQVALSSQSDEDFGEVMKELTYSFFALGVSNEKVRARLVKNLDLSDAAEQALRHDIQGAGPKGASMLAWFRTKQGNFAQAVYATHGPVKLWALSTTPIDALLRDRLKDRLGYLRALRILAKWYPAGTVTPEYEEYMASPGAVGSRAFLEQLEEKLYNDAAKSLR